ncbi:hypothetical protein TGME49_297505 [Toxoplasma gondii ME49]|uniref:Uncharacterized protein n=3 Tax=Toxoplasma gondii TaxID=5811 RepID=A0A2G8XVI9_TOXGO|nr:hypothetical protein TGME49_297505 [Toxoplasma gondii ME49]EPT32173.1 hypothetical protein TGME49_297505 [Toxoplasma gondii ME49]KYF42476.1 hypothetical protein TGARI_297505 [Toxoplasma gondii ARI]PIL99040.1 hypothetical protein TGCOUG_297505 [Toxoplasma gondii COUG]|eukprot:XP_018638366.1 hypothetical protein TGME49_297505 [Toxoplasma gondii ME49]
MHRKKQLSTKRETEAQTGAVRACRSRRKNAFAARGRDRKNEERGTDEDGQDKFSAARRERAKFREKREGENLGGTCSSQQTG